MTDLGLPAQEIEVVPDLNSYASLNGIGIFIFIFLVIIFLLWLLRKAIFYWSLNKQYHDHAIYLIRLPKEKPNEKENNNNNYVQRLHEEIARGETMFKAIGGLRAERWYNNYSWLLGRTDHFSFEIVATNRLISFYVVTPRKLARYLEQQIQAYFPEAVMMETNDYNIFHPQSHTIASYLKTKRSFIFPLKTYSKMEADPMNSLVNVLSKLNEGESIALQYIVRSSHPGWHSKSNRIVSSVHQGKKLSDALSFNLIGKSISFASDLFEQAKPNNPIKNKMADNQYKLSAMEQELLKAIEEKNSKAGLDINLRVIVSSLNMPKAKMYLTNIISAYSEYNFYQYGNLFNNHLPIYNSYIQKTLITDFIYRRFRPGISFLVNTEEMASLYHLPLSGTETPNINWLTAKLAPAPANIPEEGISLGRNIFRGEIKDVKIKRSDRRRHTYVIGKSGVGKSVLLASMAIQDIINGEGVCVIDPHGDLISDIIKRIPAARAEDVILFAPADIERPLALNLLEYDPRYPEQKTFVINEMIKIFDKLYDLKSTGGPIFEQYMRNAMLLIMSDQESGSTLMEIPKVLADAEFRKMKLERCSDPTVVDFWRKEAEKAGGDAALANIVPYITSKLTTFISNDTMRPIIGQQKSSFNLRDIMDTKKVLLVDLSKGRVGEMNAYLLGMILVGKILMSALSRTDIALEARKDFYLYIDEFQNFTTDSICSILSEARKYNLNLIMAHQYLGQLVKGNDTSIRDAVFGNVGTWVIFKIGSEDADVVVKEFSPVFNQYDLINVEKFTAYIKLLIDNTASRPFSIATVWPLPGVLNDLIGQKIKSLSRLKYGQDRNIIEAEIRRRVTSFS